MRRLLLASAALLGLTGGLAYAQTVTPGTPGTGMGTATTPNSGMQSPPSSAQSGTWTPGQEPHSRRATNIERSDTRSAIAPALPSPNLGADATPDQYLQAAQNALQHRQTGLAQSAMEMAETRMLDHSVMPSRANEPDMAPGIRELHQARDALGQGDLARASQLVTEAMNARASASSAGSNTMNSPTMSSPAIGAPAGGGSQAVQPGSPAPSGSSM